jgi:tetratricopeptide (TPR) repeat protein
MIRPAIRKWPRALAILGVCLLLAACAVPPERDTTGQGASAAATPSTGRSASQTRAKAIEAYRDYLAQYPDGPERDRVSRRLADLLVEQAAELQLNAALSQQAPVRLVPSARQAYEEAITRYEQLLRQQPPATERSEVLYQLSRAYEESGRPQQALAVIDRLLKQRPDRHTALQADTWFRRGELAFAEGDYVQAGRSYQAVVALGPSVAAYEQALYKLGWSLFKQERYADALPVLMEFLDRRLSSGESVSVQLAQLSAADREQTGDVFRVMSMSFSYLGGVQAVEAFFRRHGGRDYEEQVYLDLAQWYAERDQVSAAAQTWQALAQRDPLAASAPELRARAIRLYRQAGFQQRVEETQAAFVKDYGMDGAFWQVHAKEEFPEVVQMVQSSLQALARSGEARAQRTKASDDYRSAERWYRDYLSAFGEEPDAAELNLALAELLYERGDYREAMVEFERTAWSRGEHARAPEAALGALRASEKLQEEVASKDRDALARQRTETTLRFVTDFPHHPAAPDVLAHGGAALLRRERYDAALRLSEPALVDGAPVALRQVGWSVRAQACFGQGDYAAAVSAYRSALGLAQEADPRRAGLRQGLAMAIYRQAEQAMGAGDRRTAVALYRQSAQLASDGSLRRKAEYDAATALLAEASWIDAVHALEALRTQYPDDPLQPAVGRKLAYAYERSGRPEQAADAYLHLAQDRRQDRAVQREALQRAAELYSQIGAVQQAIKARELYLKRFSEPVEPAVMMMQELADLESDHPRRRRHWLQEIVGRDRAHGTPRTRVIAAQATLELAQDRLAAFQRVQLVNPVQESLARKLEAMKQALQALEAAIEYGVDPVRTAATYQIAGMYETLAGALQGSERPAGLSPAELAEYNVLLAEQARPFQQQAIEIYQRNTRRTGADPSDPWVEKSLQRLSELEKGP